VWMVGVDGPVWRCCALCWPDGDCCSAVLWLMSGSGFDNPFRTSAATAQRKPRTLCRELEMPLGWAGLGWDWAGWRRGETDGQTVGGRRVPPPLWAGLTCIHFRYRADEGGILLVCLLFRATLTPRRTHRHAHAHARTLASRRSLRAVCKSIHSKLCR
jgi:hypothetical protein